MTTLSERIVQRQIVLTEGAVIERLRRSPGIVLDPLVENAALVYDASGRAALLDLWRGYVDVARESGLPITIFAPTWRASPERLARAGLPATSRVCADAVALVREVRCEYGSFGERIHVAGLMGCRGDAYRVDGALTSAEALEFHAEQADALAATGLDLILAATLPSADEALGLARAISRTAVPYILGFVVRASGTLLDGTPLRDAVARLDDALDRPPLGYAGTCVHPENFRRALERERVTPRFVALQGNGSRLSPEELDGRGDVDSDSPEAFATASADVARRFGLSMVGGCCGTDDRHLRALAKALTRP